MYKFFILVSLLTQSIYALEQQPQQEEKTETNYVDVAKISQAFGHLIGKNIESMGFKFDVAKLIEGLQNSESGLEAPMTEKECIAAITAVQESAFKETSVINLKEAEEFLEKNSQQAGINSLEEGLLQYKIEKTGHGAVVQDHFSPLIRYTGKFLDGSIFGASKEDELISLDETIPGFTKGLVGMKEGEKRTLYIHPDLGYGTSGYLPPNSLLTFEIEVIRANAPQLEERDAISSFQSDKINPEMAGPLDDTKAIR